MNKYVWMGVGAVIGAGIGYVAARVIMDYVEGMQGESNSDLIEGQESFESAEKKIEEKMQEFTEKHEKIDYTAFFLGERPNPEDLVKIMGVDMGKEEEPASTEPNPEVHPEKEEDVPELEAYIISEEIFTENPDRFQVAYLNYYATDDVLTTSSGVPVEERDALLGPGTLNEFDDEGVLYVSNEMLHAFYKVTRISEKFYKERDVRTKRRKPVEPKEEE